MLYGRENILNDQMPDEIKERRILQGWESLGDSIMLEMLKHPMKTCFSISLDMNKIREYHNGETIRYYAELKLVPTMDFVVSKPPDYSAMDWATLLKTAEMEIKDRIREKYRKPIRKIKEFRKNTWWWVRYRYFRFIGKPWIFIVGKVADFKKVFIEYVDYKKFVLGMRYHRIQTKMYYNGKTIQEIIRRLFRERK